MFPRGLLLLVPLYMYPCDACVNGVVFTAVQRTSRRLSYARIIRMLTRRMMIYLTDHLSNLQRLGPMHCKRMLRWTTPALSSG